MGNINTIFAASQTVSNHSAYGNVQSYQGESGRGVGPDLDVSALRNRCGL